MEIAKNIIKNSLWLISGEVVSKVVVFFFAIIVARKLGVANYGKYGFALSFVMMLSLFTDLGLSMFLFREISRNKNLIAKYVSNIFVLRLILCFIFFVTVVSIINILNYPEETRKLTYLLGCWVILLNLSNVFRTSFKAIEKMKYEASLGVIDNLLRFIFVLFAFGLGFGVVGVGLSLFMASLFTLSLSIFAFIRKFPALKFKIDFSIWHSAFKQIIPLSVITVLITYFGRMDNIILSFFKDDTAVGIYDASLRLVWMLIFIPGFISQSTFPKLAEYAFQDTGKFTLLLTYLLKVNLFITFPVAIVISVFSPCLINLVYGEEFVLSSQTLRVLILTLPFHGMIGSLIYSLNAKNKQNVNAIFVVCTLLLNLTLDVLLVQKLSYMGIAFATLSSLFVLTVLLFIYALRHNYLQLNTLAFSFNDLELIKKIFVRKVPV